MLADSVWKPILTIDCPSKIMHSCSIDQVLHRTVATLGPFYHIMCILFLCCVQISMSVAWVLKREVTTVPSTPHVTTLLVRLTATVMQALTWPSAAGESGGVKVRERQCQTMQLIIYIKLVLLILKFYTGLIKQYGINNMVWKVWCFGSTITKLKSTKISHSHIHVC